MRGIYCKRSGWRSGWMVELPHISEEPLGMQVWTTGAADNTVDELSYLTSWWEERKWSPRWERGVAASQAWEVKAARKIPDWGGVQLEWRCSGNSRTYCIVMIPMGIQKKAQRRNLMTQESQDINAGCDGARTKHRGSGHSSRERPEKKRGKSPTIDYLYCGDYNTLTRKGNQKSNALYLTDIHTTRP